MNWQRLICLSQCQSADWIFWMFLLSAQIKSTVPCQCSQWKWHFKRSWLWSLCSFQFISLVKLLHSSLLPARQAMDLLFLLFIFFFCQSTPNKALQKSKADDRATAILVSVWTVVFHLYFIPWLRRKSLSCALGTGFSSAHNSTTFSGRY